MKRLNVGKDIKPNIVISAINIKDGGALSVFLECLEFLSKNKSNDYNLIALVHKKDIFHIPNITYYEFPLSKKSWFIRSYYEYYYFRSFSKKLNAYLWLSLHDMTPNVQATIQAVYCHNPAPFYKAQIKEFYLEPKFLFFNYFYKYFYKVNIRENRFIIVQQKWLADYFKKISGNRDVIVSHPSIDTFSTPHTDEKMMEEKKVALFYPSFPRVFKNFEVICEAAKILNEEGENNFEVFLTISGQENKYANSIHKKYSHIDSLKFIGLLDRKIVYQYYGQVDGLLFPSKLETWGMPLSEFKCLNKPIIVSDLAYAHETIGQYYPVKYFNPNDPQQLANILKKFIAGTLEYDQSKDINVGELFSSNWNELFDILLSKKTV